MNTSEIVINHMELVDQCTYVMLCEYSGFVTVHVGGWDISGYILMAQSARISSIGRHSSAFQAEECDKKCPV